MKIINRLMLCTVALLCVITLVSCDMLTGDVTCEHRYSDWKTGEAATCSSMGYETRICKKCEWLEYRFTAALEHDWRISYSAPISSTEESVHFYTCSICQLVKLGNSQPTDTDGDGLTDDNETDVFHTDPLRYDTDGDGLSDGKEIAYGFDPNSAQTTFELNIVVDQYEDLVIPSVEVKMEGDQLDTLTIEQSDFFTEDMLGFMGKAYKYDVEGELNSATVAFEFEKSTLPADADPVIYAFDEVKSEMVPLKTTVTDHVASTEVSSFSTYILVDRKQYEEEFLWIDVWDTEVVYTNIEVVFVVDDSGSMDWNDPSNERLTVARDLIDKLPLNSRIGVVSFENNTNIYTSSLTTSKSQAKQYLTTSYFASNGGTYMYTAIEESFSLFTSQSSETMQIMIILSDGDAHDTSYHNSIISTAKARGVRLYTIGLGSESSSYFNNYLKPLANNTNAAFYLSENADELAEIYNDIGVKIDLTTDSDLDGLSDYYEDNMLLFNGQTYTSDKNLADSDGDGWLDGEEIKTVVLYSADGKKMTIVGRIYSNPSVKDPVNDPLIKVRKNVMQAGYDDHYALYRNGEFFGTNLADIGDLTTILEEEVDGGLSILKMKGAIASGGSDKYEITVIQFETAKQAQDSGQTWGQKQGYVIRIVQDCVIMANNQSFLNIAMQGF